MTTYYRVIQYLPDPTNDERINIGVVVYGDGVARSRFLRNWRRVQAFSQGEIDFVKEFARNVQERVPEQLDLPTGEDERISCFGEEFLFSEAGSWINSIQFTTPRASVMTASLLLEVVSKRFLKQKETQPRPFRDRGEAKRMAYRQIYHALRERDENLPKRLLEKECLVQGKSDLHQFDIGARNGHLIFAAHALSFEVQETRDFLQEYESIAYHISDVRSVDPSLPLALVSYPPQRESKVFEKARRLSSIFDVPILTEGNIGPWSLEQVKNFAS